MAKCNQLTPLRFKGLRCVLSLLNGANELLCLLLLAMHPVAALLEFCYRRRLLHPVYELIEDCGPAHRKTFRYKVFSLYFVEKLFLLFCTYEILYFLFNRYDVAVKFVSNVDVGLLVPFMFIGVGMAGVTGSVAPTMINPQGWECVIAPAIFSQISTTVSRKRSSCFFLFPFLINSTDFMMIESLKMCNMLCKISLQFLYVFTDTAYIIDRFIYMQFTILAAAEAL